MSGCGRVALVTGAGGGAEGGIGAAVARALAAEGVRLAVNDVGAEAAAATVAELSASGTEADAFVAASLRRCDQATFGRPRPYLA